MNICINIFYFFDIFVEESFVLGLSEVLYGMLLIRDFKMLVDSVVLDINVGKFNLKSVR